MLGDSLFCNYCAYESVGDNGFASVGYVFHGFYEFYAFYGVGIDSVAISGSASAYGNFEGYGANRKDVFGDVFPGFSCAVICYCFYRSEVNRCKAMG